MENFIFCAVMMAAFFYKNHERLETVNFFQRDRCIDIWQVPKCASDKNCSSTFTVF